MRSSLRTLVIWYSTDLVDSFSFSAISRCERYSKRLILNIWAVRCGCLLIVSSIICWISCENILSGLQASSVLIFVFNKQIVHFFIQSKDEPEVIIQSITYMKYLAFSMPLMGIFSVFQGIFQGSGNTKYSMTMEIGRLWLVRLPMILIFKNYFDFGTSGIWFSMSFSNLLVCLYGLWIYRRHGWKRKTISSIDNEQLII